MTVLTPRPLEGLLVGISISESEEAGARGVTKREVNRAARSLAEALLAQGARVAFGHDWRDDGVMREVLQLAIAYRPAAQDAEAAPRMINFVPWPRSSLIPPEERERFAGALEIREVEPGRELLEADRDDPPAAAQAQALTDMRVAMTEAIDARICIGGRMSGYAGRWPGVLEEAVLALRMQRPLYLCGLYGGAAAAAVAALREQKEPPDVVLGFTMRANRDQATGPDRSVRRPDRWVELFHRNDRLHLAALNRLGPKRNEALFDARSLSEATGLILYGLARLRAEKEEPGR